MSNHDPISDMLTRIRNASQKKHTTTTIPGSKMSLSIAKVLQKEVFISEINEEGEGYKSQIILGLKYSGKNKLLFHSNGIIPSPIETFWFNSSEVSYSW